MSDLSWTRSFFIRGSQRMCDAKDVDCALPIDRDIDKGFMAICYPRVFMWLVGGMFWSDAHCSGTGVFLGSRQEETQVLVSFLLGMEGLGLDAASQEVHVEKTIR